MAEYSAGTAKIEIRPNLKGFANKLREELERINAIYGVEIVPDLSDFREQLRAELANLPKASVEVEADTAAAKSEIEKLDQDQQITVQADADTSQAAAGLDYLTRDRKVTVEVEADTAAAEGQIDAASRNRDVTVEVDADTAGAEARIDVASRDREMDIKVDVDASKLLLVSAGLAAINSQANSANGSLALVGAQATGLSILAVAASGAVGPLAAVASAASAAVGALAVLPSVAGAAAAGIAALGVGLGGIGKAFTSMGKSAGGGAAAAGDSLKQTQRQVQAAERGIVQASRRIEDAERRVADAQKDSKKAQEDLNKARQEAAEDLEELKQQLSDAALNEEEATLAVARARQKLIDAQADEDSTKLDIAEADLAHRKAIRNLEEMREKNNALARDVQAANEAGIEGSEKVQQAKEKVEQTTRREEDAQRALVEANENMVVAQERLADALEEVGKSAGGAASGGIDPFAEALANLSPNAREFVLAMQQLGDEWRDLRLTVQDNLFEGMGQAVTDLAHAQLPVLKSGLAEVAAEINGGLRANLAALASESSQTGLANLLANTASGFSGLNQAAGPLAQAMVDIGSAGSNYLPQLGDAIGAAGARFGEFLTQATQNGQFDQWVTNGVSALQSIGQTMSDVGGIISGVWGAAAAAGESSLGPMSQLLSMMNDFINSTQGQQALGSFFSSMTDGLAALTPILSTALSAIGTTVMPAISDFIQQAAPGVQVFVQAFADGLSALAPSLGPIGQLLGSIGQALAPLLPVLGELLTAILVPTAQGLTDVVGALAPVIQALATSLTPVIQQLAPVFAQLTTTLAGVFVEALEQLTPHIPQLASAFGQVFTAIAPLLPQMTELVFQVITPLLPVVGQLIGVIANFVSAFASIVSAIVPVIQVGLELNTTIVGLLATIVGFVGEAVARWSLFQSELVARAAQLVADIVGFFANMVDQSLGRIESLRHNVVQKFQAMWNNATEAVRVGTENVLRKVSDIKALIQNVFHDAGSWLKSAGLRVMSGLWDGMKEMWSNISGWFTDKLTDLRNPFSSNASGSVSLSNNATGSVRYYASGGREDHSPQIAAAGEWRVWAEEETGGEAYIPLANDYRRGRAVAITAAVANHFGYQLVDADGQGVKPGARGSLGPTDVRAFAEGGITIDDLDAFASDIEGKPYVWGGVHWGDCSGAMSGIARYVAGINPWGGRFATGNQREALAGLGFLPGLGGAGSLSIGWFNGGPWGGHTSGTLPSGTNVEMGGGRGNGQFGGRAAPANHSQYTDHAHIPADFFKPIRIPRMGDLADFGEIDLDSIGTSDVGYDFDDDYDYGVATSDPAGQSLKEFRASAAADPSALVTGPSKKKTRSSSTKKEGPSTISELVADVAKTAVAGHTKDILSVFGIADDIPMVKAYGQFIKARNETTKSSRKRSSTRQKQKDITSVSAAAESVIKADPEVDTIELTGLDIVGGLAPIKAPESKDGDIGHVYIPGAGAEQWRPMAMAAMRHVGFNADDPAQVNAMIKQIQSESSGDPNIAQQIVDVNGTGESAGVGLLQIIPGTYADHRDPTLPNDRRNPFSNMVAALRYYRSRYGNDLTTRWGKGIGYWRGGLVEGFGGPVEDNIPAFLSKSEFVVREAATRHALPLLQAINSDPQRAKQINQAFTQGATPQAPAAPGGNGVEIHYHVNVSNEQEGLRRAEMHARQQVLAMAGD